MSNTTKTLKTLIVGIAWSLFYIHYANIFTFKFWNFNFLSATHWSVISNFWESGGSIKSAKDYLFLLTIISLIPIWMIGFRFFYKLKYLNILFFPVFWYNSAMIKKYGKDSSRIVLKNMGRNSKISIDDLVNEKISKLPPKRDTPDIRQAIQEKISKAKK